MMLFVYFQRPEQNPVNLKRKQGTRDFDRNLYNACPTAALHSRCAPAKAASVTSPLCSPAVFSLSRSRAVAASGARAAR